MSELIIGMTEAVIGTTKLNETTQLKELCYNCDTTFDIGTAFGVGTETVIICDCCVLRASNTIQYYKLEKQRENSSNETIPNDRQR